MIILNVLLLYIVLRRPHYFQFLDALGYNILCIQQEILMIICLSVFRKMEAMFYYIRDEAPFFIKKRICLGMKKFP